MKTLNIFKFTLFTICFIALFALTFIEPSFAESEDIAVTRVTRITHPAYSSDNMSYGTRNIWNQNHTRILLYEDTSFTHPVYGTKGRGTVWGNITDLINWSKLSVNQQLAAYQSAAKPLPDQHRISNHQSMYWSPFSGEENIIYVPNNCGTNMTLCYLAKIDVKTNTIINYMNITPPNGIISTDTRCYGWTKKNTLVCSFHNEKWSDGGYEINVLNKTKTFINSDPSSPGYGTIPKSSDYGTEFWTLWPYHAHGHSDISPLRNLHAYGYGWGRPDPRVGVFKKDTGEWINDPYGLVAHVSWKSSNNWFLGSSCGDYCSNKSVPWIETFRIYQIYFDAKTNKFTYRELLTTKAAGRWSNYINYQSHPIATLRNDGLQFVYHGTDGKYSYEDYKNMPSVASNWGTTGTFLVDLAPVSGGVNDTPPNPPMLVE